MKFLKLIERLEDLVLAGLNLPLTPWTIVNNERLMPLLDRIREQLPQELREASQLISHRDQVIEEARRQSLRIVHDAQQQAEHMVSESQLMSAIQDEANRVKSQLLNEGETIRQEAMAEAEAILRQAREHASVMIDKTYAWAIQTTRHTQSFLSQQLHASDDAINQLGLEPPDVDFVCQGALQTQVSDVRSEAKRQSVASKNSLPPLLNHEEELALWTNANGAASANPQVNSSQKMVSKSVKARQKLFAGAE